ncbi:hypothetical protein [Alkalihalobacillus deserti]|uniref:magnesium chelatase subunit ChlI family protein n=1 Tax=Alkalihalobacillus deserti TaxID=2879466 RepID=UPI001D13E8D4|nr:hypothetical protein [Alkalihalobacillus deserti]
MIKKRVEQARQRQYDRYQAELCNARVSFERLAEVSPLTDNQQEMITQVSSKQQWSNRVRGCGLVKKSGKRETDFLSQ